MALSAAERADLEERCRNPRKWAHDLEVATREPTRGVILEHEEAAALATLLRELAKLRNASA